MNSSSPASTEQIILHISFQPLLKYVLKLLSSHSYSSLNIRSYFIQFHNFRIDHLNCYIIVYLKMSHNLFRHSLAAYIDCFNF